MLIGELAPLLHVPYRRLRYVLERGHADRWVPTTPGSGHYRDLNDGEAYALALLVQVIAAGVKPPHAEKVVALVEEGLRSIAGGFVWDYEFRPFDGLLEARHQWFAEVAAGRAFRIVTDANPSLGGKLQAFNWTDIETHKTLRDFAPCVMIRVDLTRLARLVQRPSPEPSVPARAGHRKRGRG